MFLSQFQEIVFNFKTGNLNTGFLFRDRDHPVPDASLARDHFMTDLSNILALASLSVL